MRRRRIPDSDGLFRYCNYPFSFKSQGKLFAWEKMWYLKRDQGKGTLLGSLAWERYVPLTKHVHAYGCRIVFRMNEKLRAEGKFERERRIYCGAYQLKANAVRALATTPELNEISSADVVHNIENGEIAHTDLRIALKPGDFDVEATKTAIVDRLWNASFGPLKYKSVCDRDIEPHPSSLLPPAPAGRYSETRACLYRLFSLIRFQIYSWVWGSFCQNATK
jgi:hypothetical protein